MIHTVPASGQKNRISLLSPLVFLLVVQWSLFIWIGPIFEASDDLAYVTLANAINQGTFQMELHSFHHRFATFLPVALFFQLFGVSTDSAMLWPMLCSTLLLIAVYGIGTALFSTQAGFWAALLLATNPLQIKYSLILNADIVLSCFLFLSAVCLFLGRQATHPTQQSWLATGFVLTFTGGVLAKIPIIWIIPLLLFFMVQDGVQRKNGHFWRLVIAGGTISGAGYLFFYYLITGDPLYHFHGIQQVMNIQNHAGNLSLERVYTYNQGLASYLPRLTYQPLALFFATPGALLAMALSIPLLIVSMQRQPSQPDQTGYWASFPLTYLFFLWFGSVSLSNYQPIALQENYLMPILPALQLLGGVLLARLFAPHHQDEPGNRSLLLGTTLWLLGLTGAANWMGAFKLQFILLLLPFILLLAGYWPLPKTKIIQAWSSKLAMVSLLPTLIAIPVIFHHNGSLGPLPQQAIEQEIIARYLQHPTTPISVLTDHRSVKTLPFYLGFPQKETLRLINWEEPSHRQPPPQTGKIYVLINQTRLQALQNSYGLTIPAFVKHPPAAWKRLENHKGISLYEISSFSDFPPHQPSDAPKSAR